MNIGNIDWRPLINLWSVLAYLTKYTSKIGSSSKSIASVFNETSKHVLEWETEHGMHDLWRRSIRKYYSRVLCNHDYSLFEVVHNGLRLPATVSNFGNVEDVSVGSWSKIKTGATLK